MTLLGVAFLQGIHPAQSFSLLPADSPLSVLTALGICSPGQAGIFQLALNAAPPGILTGAMLSSLVSLLASLTIKALSPDSFLTFLRFTEVRVINILRIGYECQEKFVVILKII